jgi:hypothetical protein
MGLVASLAGSGVPEWVGGDLPSRGEDLSSQEEAGVVVCMGTVFAMIWARECLRGTIGVDRTSWMSSVLYRTLEPTRKPRLSKHHQHCHAP